MTDPATPAPPSTGKPAQGGNRRNLWIGLAIAAAVLALFALWRCTNTVDVPQVIGLSQQQATVAIEAAGLRVGRVSEEATLVAPPGTVVLQSPAPNTQAPADSAVDLRVASIPSVKVPDVVGMAESQAEAELADAGLRTGAVTGSYSSQDTAGNVLSQSPAAGTETSIGAAVALEVSLGEEQGSVPDVVGLSSTDAEQVLESAGFESSQAKTTSADVDAGLVISQSPSAGTKAANGSAVKITVSTGPPAAEEPPASEPAEPQPSEPEPSQPEAPDTEPAPKPEPPEPKPEVVAVPDVTGMGPLQAVMELRKAELGFAIEWGPTADAILKVIEQDPGAGDEVDPGTVVKLTIGLPEFLFGDVSVQPLPAEPPAPEQPQPSEPTTP